MKNEKNYTDNGITFKELTPDAQIEKKEVSELYKKAFLENEKVTPSEYNLNTMSWD